MTDERDERNWQVILEVDRPFWTVGYVVVASGLSRREAEREAERYGRYGLRGTPRAVAVPKETEDGEG